MLISCKSDLKKLNITQEEIKNVMKEEVLDETLRWILWREQVKMGRVGLVCVRLTCFVGCERYVCIVLFLLIKILGVFFVAVENFLFENSH